MKQEIIRKLSAAVAMSLVVGVSLAACGGSGGGKPDSAMGGGKDALKLDNALALVDDFVMNNVK